MSNRPALAAASATLFLTGCGVGLIPEGAQVSLVEDALSEHGRSVLAALEPGAGVPEEENGRTWRLSGDTRLEAGRWLLQSPNHWDMKGSDLLLADVCDPARSQTDGVECDADFQLRACETDLDCTHGICETLEATVKAPGQAPRSLCLGHSEALLDDVYQVIASAESFVDLASLNPPDGRFEAAIRNAVTFLGHTKNEVEFRAIFGNVFTQWVDSEPFLNSLVEHLPVGSRVRISVGAYRKGLDSWNHSKIVAADGRQAIVGGHNLWTDDYLVEGPVHDLSMRVAGSAAGDTHRFANELWRFTCGEGSPSDWIDFHQHDHEGSRPVACPIYEEPAPPRGTGGAPVFTVGRLGRVGSDTGGIDTADAALQALLDSARSSIRLSLQDLGPVSSFLGWPMKRLQSLARAVIEHDVEVSIVLSNPDLPAFGLGGSNTYSNGWSRQDVLDQLNRAALSLRPNTSWEEREALKARIAERMHVAFVRFGDDDDCWSWTVPDPRNPGQAKQVKRAIGNHSKLVLVDDETFYIGSQNLYVANLAEIGMIVDDAQHAAALLEDYWNPLWHASARTDAPNSEVNCKR